MLEGEASRQTKHESQATRSNLQQVSTASLQKWHQRLGHMAVDNIRHLEKNANGIKIKDINCAKSNKSPLCEVCNTAVSHTHISRQPQYVGEKPFQWVHIDLIYEEPGLSNERYIFHFYCQRSKFNLAYVIMDRKQHTLVNCFSQAHKMIQKWGYDIQFVRMDQEAGLKSEFDAYCLQHGIWLEKTPTDTKEPNGAAERSGSLIVTVARRIKIQSGLPTKLWPYSCACGRQNY